MAACELTNPNQNMTLKQRQLPKNLLHKREKEQLFRSPFASALQKLLLCPTPSSLCSKLQRRFLVGPWLHQISAKPTATRCTFSPRPKRNRARARFLPPRTSASGFGGFAGCATGSAHACSYGSSSTWKLRRVPVGFATAMAVDRWAEMFASG